jgi:peptidoglycan/LPS O-acetylase OafA/YrhL
MNQKKPLYNPSYRSDIDGLRAIAVISVVFYHTAPGLLPGGFIGVDIFFVISGYLISLIIFKSLQDNSFSIKMFYFNRIKRIFPATILVLSFFLIAGWFLLLPDEYLLLGKHSAAGGAFISNFVLWGESGYFDIDAVYKPLLHFWSLAIEEQYYLFWPIIICSLWRYNKEKVLMVIIVIAIISFTLNVLATEKDAVEAFYSPLTRIWELLVGSTLAYSTLYFQLFKNTSKSIDFICSSLGLFLIGLCVFIYNEKVAYPGFYALLPIFAASLIIYANTSSFLNKYILGNSVLVWFGLISFPLYLWHWPILSFLRIIHEDPSPALRLTAVSVSILLSWFTFKFIERPIRYGKISNSKIFSLCGLMIIVIVSGYTIWNMEGVKGRLLISNSTFTSKIQDNFKWSYMSNDICRSNYSIEDISSQYEGEFSEGEFISDFFCIQSKRKPPTILLLGNSYANHLYPGLVQNSALSHHSILSFGNYSIDKAALDLNPSSKIQKQKTLIDEIIRKTPSLKFILIAGINDNLSTQQMIIAKERIDFIESRGIKVVVFKPHIVPEFLLKQCYSRPLRPAKKQCDFDNSFRNDIVASFEPFVNFISINDSKALFFDPNSIYCEKNRCSFIHNGLPLIRDLGHYTEYGSTEVASNFVNWAKLNLPDIIGPK